MFLKPTPIKIRIKKASDYINTRLIRENLSKKRKGNNTLSMFKVSDEKMFSRNDPF